MEGAAQKNPMNPRECRLPGQFGTAGACTGDGREANLLKVTSSLSVCAGMLAISATLGVLHFLKSVACRTG